MKFDWKHASSQYNLMLTAAVVYRIRILESDPAGYWEFFGFRLDVVSSPTGLSK